MKELIEAMRMAVIKCPAIKSALSPMARWLSATPDVKSFDYFLRTLVNLVHSVYDGYLGGDFIDIMASLVQGQLTRAYHEGVMEAGLSVDEMTPEMEKELEEFILSEYDYVDQFYRDIVDARVDGAPVDALISRASLWANRYNDVKNAAMRTVTLVKGGKLIWLLGATEEHCGTCNALNGKVAFAKEWEIAGLHPQTPPNPLLECEGWRCGCTLTPTDARRSPKVLDYLLNVVASHR